MRGVLTALDRAGSRANQRQRVIDAYLGAPARPSLLGPLKFDARGDRIAPRFTIERAGSGQRRVQLDLDAGQRARHRAAGLAAPPPPP